MSDEGFSQWCALLHAQPPVDNSVLEELVVQCPLLPLSYLVACMDAIKIGESETTIPRAMLEAVNLKLQIAYRSSDLPSGFALLRQSMTFASKAPSHILALLTVLEEGWLVWIRDHETLVSVMEYRQEVRLT